MVSWRIYQEIAGELGVAGETMQLISILGDGGYLVAGKSTVSELRCSRRVWNTSKLA